MTENGKKPGKKSLEVNTLIYYVAIAALVALGGIVTYNRSHGLKQQPAAEQLAGKVPVSIVSFFPDGEVRGTSNITVEFNYNMVDEARVGMILTEPQMKIVPFVPGEFKWESPHKLRFFPVKPFTAASEYKIKVLPAVCSGASVYLTGNTEFSFTTEKLKIENSFSEYVFELKEQMESRIQWTLSFNMNVDPDELKKNIKIYYDLSEGPKNIEFNVLPGDVASKDFKILTGVIDRSRHAEKRVVKMVVEKELRSVEGPLPLTYTRTDRMQIETDLKVYSLTAQRTTKYSYLQLQLSARVDPVLALQYVSVEPEMEITIDQQDNNLQIKGDFMQGKSYTVNVKKGLAGVDATILREDFSGKVSTVDLEPSIGFRHRGIFLPLKGDRNVAIETVNINKIRVTVQKLFMNNLVHVLNSTQYEMDDSYDDDYWYYEEGYNYSYDRAEYGRQVYTKELTIESTRNEPKETLVDFDELWSTGRKGIFKLTTSAEGEYWRSDYKLVILTDLGMIAARSDNGIFIWVNSLKTSGPVSGAEITLYSKNNQIIAQRKTNAKGIAVIEDLKEKLEQEKFEPYLLVARLEDDTSFLKFKDTRMPLSTFDVGGRPLLESGYEAFVYSDRGIYRPGDKANITAIVRGRGVSVPEAFPVKLVVLDPTSATLKEVSRTPAGGMVEFTLDVPDYSKTGTYIARLMIADEEIGRDTFSVEDFIPDKIKVTVTANAAQYKKGETLEAEISGQSLFGPPASGRKVDAKLIIRSEPFSPLRYRDHVFGAGEKEFAEVEIALGSGELDDAGLAKFSVKIPDYLKPPAALKGVISTTVQESGGRAVSGYASVDIHPYPLYIGLKAKQDGYADVDKEFIVNLVALDPEAKQVRNAPLKVNVYRYEYQSVLRKNNEGYYRYVSERQPRLVHSGDVSSSDDRILFTPTSYGQYSIEVSDPAGGALTTLWFYASGWGYAPWSMENPDRLEIEFEQKSYKVGQRAKALVKAPFPGRLLVLIERDEILEYWVEEMSGNTATVEVPVKESYRPNVYMSAVLIKKTEDFNGIEPMRAFGVAPLLVDNMDRKLEISVKGPESIRPKKKLDLDINVKNAKRETYLTVSAVDEGILQLIDFQTPDPFPFFYGKKRLQVDYFDMYSYVLPDVSGVGIKPGGDYMDKVRKKHLSPVGVRRVEPVALWSGVIKTDSRGRAKVSFDVPQFQGRLRVMVVGAESALSGSGRTDVYVRDKIVITPTFPRFTTAKDEFTVPVSLYNGTGRDAEFTVKLNIVGPASALDGASRTVSVKAEKEENVAFKVKTGNAIGKLAFKVTASGGGETTYTEVNLPINPSSPVVTKTGSGGVRKNEPLELTLPGGWLAGTQNGRIMLSGFPAVKFAKSLQYLLKYPHGCIEQTTSKVFPLLYFDNIARLAQPELFKNNGAEYYISEGINKLVSMQMHDGGFSYWPGGSHSSEWGSLYASNFLVEAKKAGYDVPGYALEGISKKLNEIVNDSRESDRYGFQNRIYAAYVLSLKGEAPKTFINYMKESKLDSLYTSSRYQLALCFAMAGDTKTARSLIPVEIHPATVDRETGGNFNSTPRENAIMLNVLLEAFPESPGIPVLVEHLVELHDQRRWYSTQDNAFAFLALGKAAKMESAKDVKGRMYVDGKVRDSFDKKGLDRESADLPGKTIRVEVENDGVIYFYWVSSGIPLDGSFDEYSKGIDIRREYLDIDGKPIDGNNFEHGQLVVAKISMKATQKDLKNVVIDDMLPAGLEVENPRLATSAGITWLKDKSFTPEYMDIRDDRLLLYTSLDTGKEKVFYYGLRAVTRGEFTLPPVSAEAMYDPSFTAINSSGIARIGERKPGEPGEPGEPEKKKSGK